MEKAVDSLARAVAQPKDEFIRDAVIQRFEYTYELCWKLLRRRLAEDQGDAEVKMLSRKELFRMASEYGLIEDPSPWFSYHKARNETSHIYDEEKAEEVYGVALSFLAAARALLTCLQERNRD